MPSRLLIHRTADDSATEIAYVLEDGSYATVRIADDADSVTIAGQLRALAARLAAKTQESQTPQRRSGRRVPV